MSTPTNVPFTGYNQGDREALCAIERDMLDLKNDVRFLRETVERLLGGMVEAQNSPGMAGMMARQMLPDMSAFTPAPHSIPKG